jgi:hypothetical protein
MRSIIRIMTLIKIATMLLTGNKNNKQISLLL